MKNLFFATMVLILMGLTSCEKDSDSNTIKHITDVGLKVTFNNPKSATILKNASTSTMTYETPENYYVALKNVTLKGANGTADFELFNQSDLSSSFVFDFTDDNTVHSLMNDSELPVG